MLRVVPAFQLNFAELEQSAGGTQQITICGGFSRQLRLLKPAEYKQVFSNACRVGTKHLTMLAISNQLGHPRLGMAISKKNVKHAVKRNLVKRQLRESFRLHQAIIGDFDVVVLARPGIDKLSRGELRVQIEHCWQKIAKKCDPLPLKLQTILDGSNQEKALLMKKIVYQGVLILRFYQKPRKLLPKIKWNSLLTIITRSVAGMRRGNHQRLNLKT